MGDNVTLALKEMGAGGGEFGPNLFGSVGQAGEACENCDELSGSTKCGEFSGMTLFRGVT